MAKNKPKVETKCVANAYAQDNERIIEYTFKHDSMGMGIGGLILFENMPDGKCRLTLYRHDPEVEIIIGKGEQG